MGTKFTFILVGVVSLVIVLPVHAESVRGYTRRDGTYVQGYTRSESGKYRSDNYGARSNGGYQRDEYSPRGGATNRSNPSWGMYDNDGDGISNSWDSTPGR